MQCSTPPHVLIGSGDVLESFPAKCVGSIWSKHDMYTYEVPGVCACACACVCVCVCVCVSVCVCVFQLVYTVLVWSNNNRSLQQKSVVNLFVTGDRDKLRVSNTISMSTSNVSMPRGLHRAKQLIYKRHKCTLCVLGHIFRSQLQVSSFQRVVCTGFNGVGT